MRRGSLIDIELVNGPIQVPMGEFVEPQEIGIAGTMTTLNLSVVQSCGVDDLWLIRSWLRFVCSLMDFTKRTMYHISVNGKAASLRNTHEECLETRISSDGDYSHSKDEDSGQPENDDWATISNGSIHTTDYN